MAAFASRGSEFRFPYFSCWRSAFSWREKTLASWRNFLELQKSKANAIYFPKSTWRVWGWHKLVIKSIVSKKSSRKILLPSFWIASFRIKVEKLWSFILTDFCGLLFTVKPVRVFFVSLFSQRSSKGYDENDPSLGKLYLFIHPTWHNINFPSAAIGGRV